MPYQSHSKTWANNKELFSGARVDEFDHIWFEKIAVPAATLYGNQRSGAWHQLSARMGQG